ncbi:MAG: hypothetical protein V2I43_19435 [Parvularcula sp.]|nr:hypothetical protein [Parvularcula sp.]
MSNEQEASRALTQEFRDFVGPTLNVSGGCVNEFGDEGRPAFLLHIESEEKGSTFTEKKLCEDLGGHFDHLSRRVVVISSLHFNVHGSERGYCMTAERQERQWQSSVEHFLPEGIQ